MKKANLNGKLSLNKETIARLNNQQMGALRGGADSFRPGCETSPEVGCADTPVEDSWDGWCDISQVNFCQSTPDMNCEANGSWNHQSCSGVPCGGTFQTGGHYCCV